MDNADNVHPTGQDNPDVGPVCPPDNDILVVDLAGAAELLGITEDGVRKRITRGKLEATKIDGRWRIMLRPPLSGGPSAPLSGRQTGQNYTQTDRTDRQTDVSGLSPTDQLAVFRDTFVMPLVAQLRELEHRLADVENERDRALAELAEMRTAQDAAVAMNPAPGRAETVMTGDDAPQPESSLLDRLLRWIRGA